MPAGAIKQLSALRGYVGNRHFLQRLRRLHAFVGNRNFPRFAQLRDNLIFCLAPIRRLHRLQKSDFCSALRAAHGQSKLHPAPMVTALPAEAITQLFALRGYVGNRNFLQRLRRLHACGQSSSFSRVARLRGQSEFGLSSFSYVFSGAGPSPCANHSPSTGCRPPAHPCQYCENPQSWLTAPPLRDCDLY